MMAPAWLDRVVGIVADFIIRWTPSRTRLAIGSLQALVGRQIKYRLLGPTNADYSCDRLVIKEVRLPFPDK